MALSDEDFRALIEQAHMLEQLTQHEGWAVYVDYLTERMRPDKVAVLNGFIDNHDKYLKITGRLQGIHDALEAPADVAKMVADERERRK